MAEGGDAEADNDRLAARARAALPVHPGMANLISAGPAGRQLASGADRVGSGRQLLDVACAGVGELRVTVTEGQSVPGSRTLADRQVPCRSRPWATTVWFAPPHGSYRVLIQPLPVATGMVAWQEGPANGR